MRPPPRGAPAPGAGDGEWPGIGASIAWGVGLTVLHPVLSVLLDLRFLPELPRELLGALLWPLALSPGVVVLAALAHLQALTLASAVAAALFVNVPWFSALAHAWRVHSWKRDRSGSGLD